MEQPSVTYCATQSVDYLSQTHKWTDTDVISSYKEICKQLDIVQEKLREEREQKAALQAQQSQRSQRGRNDNVATIEILETLANNSNNKKKNLLYAQKRSV
ncbi:unnamed protein product [Rhizophagus irregularis]|uniref:Uncharacterized protein n=1 Tax=Rhizophagus irregularis TaxID=588596 RepID=A0A915ZXP9_9GLOM|nr:unnamed protein product [Rhizophagus irregularis]